VSDQRAGRITRGASDKELTLTFASTVVDLARLQFATTSIYHFLFVPLTLGLGQSWRSSRRCGTARQEQWLRLTRFFGTLLLINFAIGVATGLVQEFEFGMNWSVYSRFVGNVFGAPLAVEGLAAFALESTFFRPLDLRLEPALTSPPPGHPLDRVLGTWLSGYFILVPTRGCSTRSATRSSTARRS
jgi:cytochrome d ubiquinol oxidase subunit I